MFLQRIIRFPSNAIIDFIGGLVLWKKVKRSDELQRGLRKENIKRSYRSRREAQFRTTKGNYAAPLESRQLGNGKYEDGGAQGKRLHKKFPVDCISLRLLHAAAYPAGVLHGSVHRLTCITRGSSLVMLHW